MSEELQERVIANLLDQIQEIKTENAALAAEVAGTMSKPCCVGIIRDSSGLAGSEEAVGDLKIYQQFAPGAKVGVIVIHDIFG